MLGRTKDQIRTTEQVNAALAACKALKLDGLIIVGGTNTTNSHGRYGSYIFKKCFHFSDIPFFFGRSNIKQ